MDAIAARAQRAEIELQSKGLSEQLAQAAVSQAVRWSCAIAAKVAPERREAVALDLIEDRLRHCEQDYLAGMMRATTDADVS